jgi:CPA2 family monovalent cation:H+ antiporter-2
MIPHQSPLIATIVAGLGLAFVFGVLANRMRLSPLVGYLVAGVVIGPFTPGFVADQALASELAELGVVLLMFGVGLHFSLHDLASVRAIAITGALGQMVLVTMLGFGLGRAIGWPIGGAIVFGLALSVASTIVVLRGLQERREIQTERGRIAVGWLIAEDLVMVLALVLLPALAPIGNGQPGRGPATPGIIGWLAPDTLAGAVTVTAAKFAAFALLMLGIGRRLIPWLLHYVAHTGSRELFRLSVLATSLGVAFGSAELFGVSFALGAFFAGMILAESPLSQQAAQDTLPLRDAFAVLFFVSVGMLFDPSILVREPLTLVAACAIVIIGNALAVLGIVLAFGYSPKTALALAASLSQIGEFSFVLAGLGVGLGLLPPEGRDLILASAILSILANPLVSIAAARLVPWLQPPEREQIASAAAAPASPELPSTGLTGHAVLVGYGRVGKLVADVLEREGQAFLVIEEQPALADDLRARGIEVVAANAAHAGILEAANIAAARWFISAVPNPFESGNLIAQARAANPTLDIIARAHTDPEVDHLRKLGANLVIMGEREIARGMAEHIVSSMGGTANTTPPP